MTKASGAVGPKGRGRRLIGPLRHLTVLTAIVAGFGALAPAAVARVAGYILVSVLIAAPLARVAFLATRWHQLGDSRFSAVAVGLLGVVLAGSVVVLMT